MSMAKVITENEMGKDQTIRSDSVSKGILVQDANANPSLGYNAVQSKGYVYGLGANITIASSSVPQVANLNIVAEKITVYHANAGGVWLAVYPNAATVGGGSIGAATASVFVPGSVLVDIPIHSSPQTAQVGVILATGSTSTVVSINAYGNSITASP